jgi:hypothetical protein
LTVAGWIRLTLSIPGLHRDSRPAERLSNPVAFNFATLQLDQNADLFPRR